MDCDGCIWHVKAHYNGTPKNEMYDECEYHWMVLHDNDRRCEHYTDTDVGKVTEYLCPHCNSHVYENNLYNSKAEEGIESYPYVCPECDENFYGIEVRKE